MQLDTNLILCAECGEAIIPDPAGSEGVWVHDPDMGDRAFDLNEYHAPLPASDR